jgi:hypothetical protein
MVIPQTVTIDPVTQYFLQQRLDILTRNLTDGRATNIVFELPYRFMQGVG